MFLFVSHSWHDKPMAFDLVRSIRDLTPHVEVWHDCEQLRIGDCILDSVEAALDAADLMVVIWSSAAAGSDGVRHELDYAVRNGASVVLCRIVGPRLEVPEFPPALGRIPLALDLPVDADEEQLSMVAAGVVTEMMAKLAEDDEVQLPASDRFVRPTRGLGASLLHLVAGKGVRSIEQHRSRWPKVLRRGATDMTAGGDEISGDLAKSIDVLDAVVDAVNRRPTDRHQLLELRRAAEQLVAIDPKGATQAIKVIDLRLEDPKR